MRVTIPSLAELEKMAASIHNIDFERTIQQLRSIDPVFSNPARNDTIATPEPPLSPASAEQESTPDQLRRFITGQLVEATDQAATEAIRGYIIRNRLR